MVSLEFFETKIYGFAKGQLISKANFQAVNSSKKQTNEFIFITTPRCQIKESTRLAFLD